MYKKTRPKWMNKKLKRLCRKKYRLWNKLRASKNDQTIKTRYDRVAKLLKKQVKMAKQEYEFKIAKESKNNPKLLYSYINKQNQVKDTIRMLEQKGKIVTANVKNRKSRLQWILVKVDW